MMLSLPRLIPHICIFLLIRKHSRITPDLARWAEIHRRPPPAGFAKALSLFVGLMTFVPEFRTLFYLRAGLAARAFAWMCPPLGSLHIDSPDIGAGLFIQHGVATIVSADRIGANCWIDQHVAIGYSNDTDRPTIGNDVRIGPGAKIIGRVKVGDHATIGPNTVVLYDVEANVTMLGVPGRVVQRSATRPD
jgi:serine O-acetyltransferase